MNNESITVVEETAEVSTFEGSGGSGSRDAEAEDRTERISVGDGGVSRGNTAGKVRIKILFNREFDPGSGRTLAACLTHASRTDDFPSGRKLVADG